MIIHRWTPVDFTHLPDRDGGEATIADWDTMELLGRVMPSIRQVGLELTTGAAWLLLVWLAIATQIPEARARSTSIADSDLGWAWESAAAAAGVSFTAVVLGLMAYLVGSTYGYVWNWFIPQTDPRVLRSETKALASEANLRLRLTPPLLGASLLLAAELGQPWFYYLPIVPVVVALDGHRRWTKAKSMPIKADLTGVDLSNFEMSGCNATYVDLSGANLKHADLSDSDMQGASLASASLEQAVLAGVDLTTTSGLAPEQLTGVRSLRRAKLRSQDLSGLDMRRVEVEGIDLRHAQLCDTNWYGCNLTRADLRFATGSDLTLVAADLRSSLLYGASIPNADLGAADLSLAQVSRMPFRLDDEGPVSSFSGSNMRWMRAVSDGRPLLRFLSVCDQRRRVHRR